MGKKSEEKRKLQKKEKQEKKKKQKKRKKGEERLRECQKKAVRFLGSKSNDSNKFQFETQKQVAKNMNNFIEELNLEKGQREL